MDIHNFLASILSLYFMVEFVFTADLKEATFYVKPGAGTLSVEHEVNGYKCKFTYAAQGGTHEEWAFSVELVEGGSAVMCTVERDRSSYLFFEHFKMELTGQNVFISETDIKATQRDNKYLQASEYTKDKNEVSSTSQFKNHLEKIAVYSPLPRVDL